MPDHVEAGEALFNANLKQVHAELIDLAVKLDKAVAKARTAAQVKAILDELTEVNARVTMVGSQLFTRQTAAIAQRSKAVLSAVDDVRSAIKNQEDIRDFIKGVSKFLALVDKLIDTAKLVI